MIGTSVLPSPSTRSSSLKMRTVAIVVATSCLPDPLSMDFSESAPGTVTGV